MPSGPADGILSKAVPVEGVQMAFIAFDIGSGSIRCALSGENGRFELFDRAATPVHPAADGGVEIDGEEVCEIVLGMVARASRDRARLIRGLGFSCLGSAFVPVGPNGEATGRALSPLDARPPVVPPADLAADDLYRRTGQNPHAMSSMYQLRYLVNSVGYPLAGTTSFLSLRGLLVARLCGVRVEDHSWASRTMLYDWRVGDWADDLLAYAGVSRTQMPQIVESTRALPVVPERAGELGLDVGAVAIVGGLDNCCAVAAAGADPRTLVNISGTFEHLSAVVPGAAVPAFVPDADAFAFRSVRPDEAVACSRSTTGRALERLLAAGTTTGDYLERGVAPGPNRTEPGPELEVARLLDRGCFEMRRFLDAYERAVEPVGTIIVVGGGARSTAALQRKANVLGRRLLVATRSEASLDGALRLTRLALDGTMGHDVEVPRPVASAPIVESHPDLHAAFEPYYKEFIANGS